MIYRYQFMVQSSEIQDGPLAIGIHDLFCKPYVTLNPQP
jgi:hypothetical protein